MRTRRFMAEEIPVVAGYVDAAAAALGMPLAAEHRDGVIAAMTRLAAFAADIATVELPNAVEIAGVFVP
jgi:sugar (pentulose or hexulose) kinase